MVTKSKRVSRVDEISELSDDLLVKILSYLPTKVAVSTSILSKRWEYLWMWLPKLKYSAGYIVSDDSECKRLKCFLDLNLPLHRAPVIDSFHLDLCSFFKPQDVKLWLVIAISRYVRDLDITYFEWPDKVNVLPSSLYTCKSLVNLRLRGNIPLDVPRMGCLPSLKTLKLLINDLDGVSLQQFLSICPVLEDLSVMCDNGDNNNGLITVIVPSLQSLSIHTTSESCFERFVLDTPTLKYLELVNLCEWGHPYMIENIPNLEDAYVEVRYPESDILSLLGAITSVKRLTICSDFVHSDVVVFNQLEHLKLCVCVSEDPLSHIFWFLEDSPNLRVLDINVHCNMAWEDDPELIQTIRSSLQAYNWPEYLERRPQERDLQVYILGQRWSPKDCNNLA